MAAGAECDECGGSLLFRNRTAAERGEAECGECGHEQIVPLPAEESLDDPEAEREHEAARLAPVRRVPATRGGSAPVLGAAILAGLALGAAAGYLIRRG